MGALPSGDPLRPNARSGVSRRHDGGRQRGLRRDEDGQLLLLAGIVLTISFIVTALTLTQVAALEKEAAQLDNLAIVSEWRFLHERLAGNVRTAVTPETTLDTFKTSMVPTIAATFRGLAAEKGYDFMLRLSGGPEYEDNEGDLIDAGGNYDATTYDGTVTFTHPQDADPADGVIWQTPCPDPSGPLAGCIAGVYLHARLADATASMQESILFAVNQP